ncbi:MAG: hypothetical protein K6T88_04155 [Bacillus sp. (in: Bacteria)]|nr:hypothetical protein [Bacillus sp. (in: firmicutes)]
MLSFEEKRAIFHSFKLKEKKVSNGKINFVYPESKQRGQVLATQLHPTRNGYILGKYMSDETIKANGYKVDSRGWISIKVFSKDEMMKVINEAMKSMGRMKEIPKEVDMIIERKEAPLKVDVFVEINDTPGKVDMGIEKKVNPVRMDVQNNPIEMDQPSTAFEHYPCSHFFVLMGLTLTAMGYGCKLWRKAVRKYVGI